MFHVKQKRVAFRCPAGACLLCRRLTLPLVYFSAPIPPTPFPRGEGGDFWFSYARGFAPCIPGIKSPTALTVPAASVSGGGVSGWLPAALAFSLLFCPHPPDPLPGGKGEIFLFSYARGSAPCIPGAKPGRHWLFLPHQCFLPPSPRPPSRREGGDFCFILPGADAPGTPATEPAQHWLNRGGAGAPGTPATEPARCWLAGRLRPLHPRG